LGDYNQREYQGTPTFLYFTAVPAPKCISCGAAMIYTKEATRWACQAETCPLYEVAVETGIGGVVWESP